VRRARRAPARRSHFFGAWAPLGRRAFGAWAPLRGVGLAASPLNRRAFGAWPPLGRRAFGAWAPLRGVGLAASPLVRRTLRVRREELLSRRP